MRIIFRLSVGIICIGLIYDLHAETNFCGSPTPEVTLTIDGLAKNTLKINIPVVMHVIFASNGEGNVHDWQLQAQIDTINSAFSKNGTNYSFFLAGVSRTENDEWWVTSRQTLDEIEMKNALSIDPAHVLNIYIAALSGYNGWATYPWEEPENSKYQGIVIDYKSLPGGVLQNHDKGGIAVHEIGHYLGLYHTYLRGCLYPGDEIDDTPYHLENTGCPGPNTDTCPEKPGLDPVHNYLNATSDDCMHEFTADQSDRMDAMVATYKPNLGGTSINVTNDLNIPISRKWYFRNITLKFANNIKISVDGKFELDNVTLTSNGTSWGGIRFNSGSGGEIYNCNLYKCGYPYYIYIYNASPTIRGNTLTQWAGAYNGIYVRGSTADPTLYDNDIEINYTGVRFDNYAEGELSYNLIHVTNMYDPVLYAVGGAWVDADYRGANTFREGRYGISAQSSARVDASGTFSENDFCETGVYDLYATSSSSIYANYCNFPGASPTTYADGTSTITTQYASNSDGYCSQLSKANTLAGLESPRGEPLHPVDLAALAPLDRAWHGLKTGQLAAAEADFLALLETERAHQALTGLAHVYTRNQSPAIFNTITRLASTAGPLQAHAMEVESHCYVIQGEEQKALTTAKELAERFPESEYGFQSRITAMYMHYHRGELAPAAELLAETTARNETDAATIRMIHHVLERAGANVTALAVEKATPLLEASHPWDETVVVAPNPYDVGSGTQALQFFHLPTSARIQLYDVAGRHRLTTASQGANAALTLSAQDYPAGVYLYVVEELDGADGAPTGKRTTGKFVIIQ